MDASDPNPLHGMESPMHSLLRTVPLRGLALCVLAVLAVLAGVPGGAFAAEEDEGARYAGWTVQELAIEGWPKDLGAVPRSGLALGQKSGVLRPKRPVFRTELLRKDRRRLLLALARGGYPDARLEVRFEPTQRRQRFRLVITVQSGPRVTVGAVEVTGLPESLENLAGPLRDRLKPGVRFADATVEQVRSELETALRERGHSQASVRVAARRAAPDRADLEFTAEPGGRYRFAGVRVTGLPGDLARLAHRSADIPAGGLYSPARVERARENLRRLQLFRQIRLQTVPVAGGEDGVDSLRVLADLRAAKPRTYRLGAGSWSDEPWRLTGFWRHRNLFGGGRSFEIAGEISRHVRSLETTFGWPALLTHRSRSELTVGTSWEDEDSYTLTESRIETAHLFPLGTRTSLRLSAELSSVEYRDLSDQVDAFRADDGLQLVVRGRLHRDRSDDLLDPTRGHRASLDLAWSPPGDLSSAPFWSAEVNLSAYRPLPGGLVLAARATAGAAGPLGDALDLLPNRRFYAGGVNTMRGFKRRKLGPLDAAGDPLGGDRLALAGAELRVPVVGPVGLALFADGGQLKEHGRDRLGDGWRTAVGCGVSVGTPVGPVRLDWAYNPENPPADQPRQVLHLSIGHPY